MDSLSPFRTLALGALVLALGACDSAVDGDPAAANLDAAAAVVASAVALDTGGALEDVAAGASLAASLDAAGRSASPDRPGCDNSRDYDEATSTWTVSIDCERGDPDGERYAQFARLSTYQFLDADGEPQRERRGAASLTYRVLSGESEFRLPRRQHTLASLGADLAVTRLDGDLVSVSGTYARTGSARLTGERGERTVEYALSLDLDEVEGPASRLRRWRGAVAGTITGTLQATITRTPAGGEAETVEVDRDFTVTFPTDALGGRVAQITLGGLRYRADVETGDLLGLP